MSEQVKVRQDGNIQPQRTPATPPPISTPNEPGHERRLLVQLVILAALGVALGRLASAERIYEPTSEVKRGAKSMFLGGKNPNPMPTFGSNDRSRWATVRSLVEQGTFVIGERSPTLDGRLQYIDRGIIFEDGWQSVDKVLHPTRSEFYSSKPPLLSVLMAGAYYPLYHWCGVSLKDDPFTVVRILVGLLNLLPLPLYLWLLYRLGERYLASSWAGLFLLTAGAFGTLLNPFLITFSNHVPGVYCTLFLLVLLLKIDREGSSVGIGWYALAGLLAGFNATCELPALSLTALAFVVLARVSLTRSLLGYLPAAILPLVLLVGLNYLVLERLTPIYAETSSAWYQYEGSHWLRKPTSTGIDYAYLKESRADYAFHLLIGHHGFFSLTPLFLLSLAGLVVGSLPGKQEPPGESKGLPWWYSPSVLLISVVVIGFYLVRSNNYGGVCNGARWLMWLIPLWLVAMIPVIEKLATSSRGRWLAMFLLLMSILSASYFDWNPWRHPWIYNWMERSGQPLY